MKNDRILKMYNMSFEDIESLSGFKLGLGKASLIENDKSLIKTKKEKNEKESLKERSHFEKRLSKIKHARNTQKKKEEELLFREVAELQKEDKIYELDNNENQTVPENMIFELV